MSDAQAEAERVVDAYGIAIAATWQEALDVAAVSRFGDPCEPSAETVERAGAERDRLVAALAAAIEWQDSRGCVGKRSIKAAQRLRDADLELENTLSALRQTDGEEPT